MDIITYQNVVVHRKKRKSPLIGLLDPTKGGFLSVKIEKVT